MTRGTDDAFEFGLSKREYFATKAMEQIVHRWSRLESPWTPIDTERCAERSVQIADALIEALNKKSSTDPER